MSCPSNHELKEFMPFQLKEFDSFRCDGCMKSAKPTDTLYGCRRCNYDLCESCYGKNQSKIKCEKGHTLIYTLNRKYSTAGYICDKCFTSFKRGKSYHCKYCEYDLCSKCHENAAKVFVYNHIFLRLFEFRVM